MRTVIKTAGDSAIIAETSPSRRTCVHYHTVTPDQRFVIEAWRYWENPDVVYGAIFERGGKTVPFIQQGDGEPVYTGEFPDYIRGTVELVVAMTKKILVADITNEGGEA